MTDENKMPREIWARVSKGGLKSWSEPQNKHRNYSVLREEKYIRADLVAEKDRRIADLLEANNRYLERAIYAEQALEKGELIVAYMAGFEQGKDEANRKDGE